MTEAMNEWDSWTYRKHSCSLPHTLSRAQIPPSPSPSLFNAGHEG